MVSRIKKFTRGIIKRETFSNMQSAQEIHKSNVREFENPKRKPSFKKILIVLILKM